MLAVAIQRISSIPLHLFRCSDKADFVTGIERQDDLVSTVFDNTRSTFTSFLVEQPYSADILY